MKLKNIKIKVYLLTSTTNTKQLKNKHKDVVLNRDLRYKISWLEILKAIELVRGQREDISLDDLKTSEIMLKKSLITVGKLAEVDIEKIEVDWQRIQLEAQFKDIHIEEL